MNCLFVYRSFLSMFFNVFSYICICLFLFLFCFHLNVTLTICVNFLVSVICFVSFLSVFLFLYSTFLSLILTNMRSNSLFLLFTFCVFLFLIFNVQSVGHWQLSISFLLLYSFLCRNLFVFVSLYFLSLFVYVSLLDHLAKQICLHFVIFFLLSFFRHFLSYVTASKSHLKDTKHFKKCSEVISSLHIS